MSTALRMRCPLLALVLCFLLGVPAFAQMETATLSGVINDPNGGVVPDVEVSATRIETGTVVTTRTNGAGIYFFTGLMPGHYHLVIRKPGFKEIAIKEFQLYVQDKLEQNFALEIGSVSESITVSADDLHINTTDAAVGTVVDRKFVENTPLNGRSFQDLISMTPGVVTQNPNKSTGGAGSGGDFSVNGQRTESNYYTVDGVSANVNAGTGFGGLVGQVAASGSVSAGTVLGTTQSLVSVDALQEFRVQSSTYSAEYGRAPGGQFSLVTRSGTNDLHGTLFDYFRNDFFDANDWFNNRLGKPTSALRQNDFGGTLGGPIRIPRAYNGRDKTFFFFSYEGLRLVQPQAASTNQLVPDTFMRQQAPAALEPILNAFPLPNGKDFGSAAAPSLAQLIQPFSLPSQLDSTSVRIDHTFGPKLSLFLRVADTPSSTSRRNLSLLSQFISNTQAYILGAGSQLGQKANNDLRLGYSRSYTRQQGVLDNFGGATPIDLATALGAGPSAGSLLQFVLFIPGAGISNLTETKAENRLQQWNLVDTFSIVSGHNQFKMGADYRRIISPNTPASPTILANYFSAQSILNNTSSTAVLATLNAKPIFNETAIFFQDEWHIAPSLNLSLGLRWEVDPAPHGANGNDAYTLFGDVSQPGSLTLAPRGTALWSTTWYNFAPRLGVAWTLRNKSGWETVIRAGSGVFFDTDNQQATSGFAGLGFGVTSQFVAPLPVTAAQLNITPSVDPPFKSNIYVFPAHLQLPYTLQWNLAIQQAIGTKQTIKLTYVGAAARRLIGAQSLSLQKLNPLIFTSSSRVTSWTPGLTSDYDALQIQFQRSVSRGIHGLASYTWSHCLDSGSSYSSLPTGPGLGQTSFVRGNCEMDVRHNLEAGGNWDLPSVGGNRFLQTMLNHWGLDGRLMARTGFPVPLCGNQLIDPATGSQYCTGLNVVPNRPLYVYGTQYPGDRSINAAAFSPPAPGALGDAPRNFVRGFGAWQFNMAVRRDFPIRERLRLQFRAEAFNILNHPNFGFIDPNCFGTPGVPGCTNPTFGQALFMLNQNLGTVASQYQQGGPRSMQFALKFLF